MCVTVLHSGHRQVIGHSCDHYQGGGNKRTDIIIRVEITTQFLFLKVCSNCYA
jgi:hypothetical protein